MTIYLCLDRALSLHKKEGLQTDEGIVDYWMSKIEYHRLLAQVALRVIATPPSSCARERNFRF